MKNSKTKFKQSFFQYTWHMIAHIVILFFASLFISYLFGVELYFNPRIIPRILISVLVILVYAKWVTETTFVIVSKEGISGKGFLGKQKSFKWEDQCKLKVTRITIGLKFIRLYSKSEKFSIWISVFLKDFDGFIEAVKENAPKDNTLYEFLVKNQDKLRK